MSERPGPSPEEQKTPENHEGAEIYDESLKNLTYIVVHHPDAKLFTDEPQPGVEWSYKKLDLKNVAGLEEVSLIHWGEYLGDNKQFSDYVAEIHLPYDESEPTWADSYEWHPRTKEIKAAQIEDASLADKRFINEKLNEIRSELERRGEI